MNLTLMHGWSIKTQRAYFIVHMLLKLFVYIFLPRDQQIYIIWRAKVETKNTDIADQSFNFNCCWEGELTVLKQSCFWRELHWSASTIIVRRQCYYLYMTGVFPQRPLVVSCSRGRQHVVILHWVQYHCILMRGRGIWRVWYIRAYVNNLRQRVLF